MTDEAEGPPARVSGAFIGRESQLAELATELASSRLIVLTGPPGVGKTRLALEVAARNAHRYPEGAYFVELAGIRDPALVPVAVARALRVWEQPDRPVTQSVIARLTTRQLLLVLDNCEQILQACGELAKQVLESCPALTILATSQEALGISRERIWPVAPLAVPTSWHGPEQPEHSDAVSLFCARATSAKLTFHLTDANVQLVADICRRLDGIPLAIELAAARVTVLSLPELLSRLDQRFVLLTGYDAPSTPRHQTLRAALEWSYDLLSQPEQAVLHALSAFPAGCGPDAVEAACALRGRAKVRAGLAGLVAKSLIRKEPAQSGARYQMLETVRLFAAECLADSGESPEVHVRQAGWCLTLAERAEGALTGADQIHWLDILDREYANLRAALTWSCSAGRADTALRLAGALTIYWRVRGYFREGLERLNTTLSMDEDQSAGPRAKALWGAGFMALMVGDRAQSRRLSEQSLALAEQACDLTMQARALLVMGNAAGLLGAAGEALDQLTRSGELARQAGDAWCLAHARGMSGFVHLMTGDRSKAKPLLEDCLRYGRRKGDQQSLRLGLLLMGQLMAKAGVPHVADEMLGEGLQIARALREPYAISMALSELGSLAASQGDHARAREMLESALNIERELGANSIRYTLLALAELAHDQGDLAAAAAGYTDVSGMGLPVQSLLGLGELAIAGGRLQDARLMLQEAGALALTRDSKPSQAIAKASLARLARAQGDFQQAISLHIDALRLLREVGDTARLARLLEEMAGLAAELGAPERAARLFGAASALRDRGSWVRPPVQRPRYEADVAATRARLDAKLFERKWAEGAALPLGEALRYASRWKGTRGRTHPGAGWAGLTMAEREIAALAAGGMTNAEVGAQLGISSHTVRVHLVKAFAILDISSRRQLRRVVPCSGSVR